MIFNLTLMESIAWFMILVSVTKIIFILVDKKGFFKLSKQFLSLEGPWLPLLGLGLFLYLRTRGLSAVTMMSCVLVMSLFTSAAIAPYSKPFLDAMRKDTKFLSKMWLNIVCWLVIVCITLIELI